MAERGYSLQEIAKTFERVKSAIWYELQKKRKGKKYDASYAKHLSYVRMRAKRKEGKKIALDKMLREFVEKGLMDDQSPEAIEGRIKHVETKLERTSAFAIRRFIKSPYGRKIEAHRLKVFKKKRHARPPKAIMDGKRMISKRPKRINDRKGLGHMEGDFIVSGKSGKGIVLTLTDRKVRKSLLERILPVSIANVERALVRMKKRCSEMQSITFDNDLLLLEHKRLEKKLDVTIYFCYPRSPWEKPSVEHLNKVLRRYIPKSSDISQYSKYFIKKLEEKVNRRFMECLGFLTPDEAYGRGRKQKNRPRRRREKKG